MSAPARAALLRADLEARRAAQHEFERPLVLEAGAGTGKTAILVARLLAWSLGPGWERGAEELGGRFRREGRRDEPGDELVAAAVLDRVVAITFTDAAAAEMAERVADSLSEVIDGKPPPWLDDAALPALDVRVERARALLVALDHLVVCTIHAFCRRLLARYPLEVGLHPDFTVDAEGVALDQAVHEVVQEHLRRAFGASSDPQALALAAMGISPGEIAEALTLLVARGVAPEALEREPYGPEAVAAMRRRLAGAIAELRAAGWTELASARNQKVASEVLDALAETERRLAQAEAAEAAGLEAWCAALRQSWPKDLRGRLREWGRGKLNRGETAALGERAATFEAAASRLSPALDAWLQARPQLLGAAFRVLAPLLGEVQRALRSRGAATFDDLLRLARDLLVGHPEVAARERAGIAQLLVDEFQDTDRIQCEMLEALALRGAPGGCPGLFLVGDPKQSIYGWRSADLAAYEWFVGAVEAGGGRRMTLSVNFRSVPAILDEVERAVAPSMVARPAVQPPFEPLAPSPERADRPGFSDQGRATVEYWVSWLPDDGAKTRSADAAALEARAIAADIRELHETANVNWSGFGLLLRAGSDIDDYLQALRSAGVPYTVERDRSYYRRREVIEAAALVRTVLDPTDHLAMVTWLRSPSVGVPDAALMPLWSQGLPGLVTELAGPTQDRLAELRAAVQRAAALVPNDVPGVERVSGWPTALLAAIDDLATLRAAFRSDSGAAFVERLRTTTLIEATEAARVLGRFRLANLDRFFRLLLTALEASAGDPQAVLRVLRRAIAEGQEAEEGRPRETIEDAVRVMTIHKAKGLHFDHTYLVQTHKRTRSSVREELDAARSDGGWELRLFGAPTPGWGDVEARREEVRDAELVRTLYVALTRARERLVVLGRWSPGAAGGAASSHLDLLRRRSVAPPDLEQLWTSLEGTGRWHADEASARWVFPALAPAPPEGTGAEEATDLVGAAEVRRQHELLKGLADQAKNRMQRPFFAPATEEAHRMLAEGRESAARRHSGAGPGRGLAMAVGKAVHRVLETVELEAGLAASLLEARAALPELLAGEVAATELEAAMTRAAALLRRFAASPLAARLAAVAPHVLGREVPVLLPPEAEGEGPVGYVAGVIDLLLRDPATGEIVVVDYKTDEVEAGDELERRAAAYALQGLVYARAVREALELPLPPRVELWFLWPGLVKEVNS